MNCFLLVSLMSLSQSSDHDPMDTSASPLSSTHGYSLPEGLYPSPPPSPTSQPTYRASATPEAPWVQQDNNTCHLSLMSPPYSPPTTNPSQIINSPGRIDHGDHATASVTSYSSAGTLDIDSQPNSPLLYSQITPIPTCMSTHNNGAIIVTGAQMESLEPEKVYSEDDLDVLMDLAELIHTNPQKFNEVANVYTPEPAEKLRLGMLTNEGQVRHIHKTLKKKFELLGKQLNRRRLNRILTLECEESMQF